MKNILTELAIFTVLALAAYLISLSLKNKPEHKKMIPFTVLAIVILAMETTKQVYSLIVGYDLYYIPLQICSVFLFSYPMMAFGKGKARDYGMCLSLCLGASVAFAQLFLSQILTRDYIFKLFTPAATPFHYYTIFYHHLVVLHFMLMLLLKPYKPQKRDAPATVIIYASFMIVSCIFANLLKTNYSGYINYGANVFDYFKRYGQVVFNLVGFCLNTLEYLLGLATCFLVYRLVAKRTASRGLCG